MDFFGWPVAPVAVALLALTLGGAVPLVARGGFLIRLGTRNVPRRRLRAALIVFGLTLSTTVLGAAFGTGDTITYTLRALVTESLGTVDEVIVINPPRTGDAERARSLLQGGGTFGGLRASDLGFFAAGEADRLREATRESRAIAALEPAIADQVTVIHGETQQLQTAVALLAIRTPPEAFGTLRSGEGAPLRLEDLAPDEVVLNAAAAGAFGAETGGALLIRADSAREWPVRIAAVAPNGGIGGVQPLLIAPLASYQRQLGQEGRINQILVANRGGVASVSRTDEASTELRATLVNREAARGLRDFLARPEVGRALLEAEGSFERRDRERLAALRAEAARPEMTDRFVSLLSDPRARQQLGGLARGWPNWSERRAIFANLNALTTLSVVEVKREGLDQAAEYGNVVTTIFLVLGIFSIGASILLIHLIFALLAADRGGELATMRALGMRRRQIMGLFVAEGLVYNLLGAALGAVAGLAATVVAVDTLRDALGAFGFAIATHIEPRTPLTAFAGGATLTFATMLLAAWRVSRTQIVAATRGEEVAESRAPLFVLGALTLCAALAVWSRWGEPPRPYLPRHPLVTTGALSLATFGGACCLLALPGLG
ncbi:MAG: FtsX-like permease family protein, partial [Chloroflexota bacterium]|nr:FtsX-like permease family protein [Chloroflexota bacterium]